MSQTENEDPRAELEREMGRVFAEAFEAQIRAKDDPNQARAEAVAREFATAAALALQRPLSGPSSGRYRHLSAAAAQLGEARRTAAQFREMQKRGRRGGVEGSRNAVKRGEDTRKRVRAAWDQLAATGAHSERNRAALIARRLGITPTAVRAHLAALGLRKAKA